MLRTITQETIAQNLNACAVPASSPSDWWRTPMARDRPFVPRHPRGTRWMALRVLPVAVILGIIAAIGAALWEIVG